MSPRSTYPTDLTDAQWELIRPLIDELRQRVRIQAGRNAEPSLAVIDSQSVKAAFSC